MGPVLFNVVFSGIDEEIKGTFSKFAHDTRLSGAALSCGVPAQEGHGTVGIRPEEGHHKDDYFL